MFTEHSMCVPDIVMVAWGMPGTIRSCTEGSAPSAVRQERAEWVIILISYAMVLWTIQPVRDKKRRRESNW